MSHMTPYEAVPSAPTREATATSQPFAMFEHATIALDAIGPSRIQYVYDPTTRMRGIVVIDTVRFPVAGGGVRMASDVTLREITRLARAMTYKYALLDLPCGGAKAGIWLDPSDTNRHDVVAAFVEAIRPLVERGAFFPGADMGTTSGDFDALYGAESTAATFARQSYEGMPLESLVTGAGVVAAARAACEHRGESLRGATVAIEGFGKVGAGAAKFFAREGARLVAVSTVRGALYDPNGLDVDRLLKLRDVHGDAVVERYEGARAIAREALFELPVDVLVPGARPDVIHRRNVEGVLARWIAPAANIPYGEGVVPRLHARGCIALPDFVTNAGGVIAQMAAMQGSTADAALEMVRARIGENVRQVLAAARDASCSPYDAAIRMASERVLGGAA